MCRHPNPIIYLFIFYYFILLHVARLRCRIYSAHSGLQGISRLAVNINAYRYNYFFQKKLHMWDLILAPLVENLRNSYPTYFRRERDYDPMTTMNLFATKTLIQRASYFSYVNETNNTTPSILFWKRWRTTVHDYNRLRRSSYPPWKMCEPSSHHIRPALDPQLWWLWVFCGAI